MSDAMLDTMLGVVAVGGLALVLIALLGALARSRVDGGPHDGRGVDPLRAGLRLLAAAMRHRERETARRLDRLRPERAPDR